MIISISALDKTQIVAIFKKKIQAISEKTTQQVI